MDEHHPSITIAAASRPHPHFVVSGDKWSTHRNDTSVRIAVIDGLGHGEPAALAADRALATLGADPDMSPGESIQRCHFALVGTRGAAMAVARVRLDLQVVTYSAVGNVESEIWDGRRVRRPIAHRGIVGGAFPRIREEAIAMTVPDWVLVIYSDGIRQRFSLESLSGFVTRDAQSLADEILAEWSRPTDDAIVVVAMSDR